MLGRPFCELIAVRDLLSGLLGSKEQPFEGQSYIIMCKASKEYGLDGAGKDTVPTSEGRPRL